MKEAFLYAWPLYLPMFLLVCLLVSKSRLNEDNILLYLILKMSVIYVFIWLSFVFLFLATSLGVKNLYTDSTNIFLIEDSNLIQMEQLEIILSTNRKYSKYFPMFYVKKERELVEQDLKMAKKMFFAKYAVDGLLDEEGILVKDADVSEARKKLKSLSVSKPEFVASLTEVVNDAEQQQELNSVAMEQDDNLCNEDLTVAEKNAEKEKLEDDAAARLHISQQMLLWSLVLFPK